MKELLIFALLIAAGLLWLDDNSNRTALQQEQIKSQELAAERDQLRARIASTPTQPTLPAWFQQRLQERPASLSR